MTTKERHPYEIVLAEIAKDLATGHAEALAHEILNALYAEGYMFVRKEKA